MSKKILFSVMLLLVLASAVSASLSSPTTYSIGYKIWGKYYDLMGEAGIQNGSFYNMNGSGLYGLNASNATNLNAAVVSLGFVTNATMYNSSTTTILGGGGIIVTTNAANNYTISGDPFLLKWDLISYNQSGFNTKYATVIVKDSTFLTTGQYLTTNNVAGNGFTFSYYSGDTKNKTLNMLGENLASRIAIYHNNVNITMFANLSAEDPDTAWNVTLSPKKGINTINITAEDNHAGLYNYVYRLQSLWVTDP